MFTVVLQFEGRNKAVDELEKLRNRFIDTLGFGSSVRYETGSGWWLMVYKDYNNPEDSSLLDLVTKIKQWAGQWIKHVKRIDVVSNIVTDTMGKSSRPFGNDRGLLACEIGFNHHIGNPSSSRLYVEIGTSWLIEESLAELAKALPKFIRNIRICDLAIQAQYRLEKQHDYSGVRRDLETIIKIASADCQNVP